MEAVAVPDRWTPKKREAFNETMDLVLAMTDMAIKRSKRGLYIDKSIEPSQFQEAELVLALDAYDGHAAAIATDSDHSQFWVDCDPRTDLPKRFSVATATNYEGTLVFHQLASVPISELRGRRLLSPYVFRTKDMNIDLTTGEFLASSGYVFWVNGQWVADCKHGKTPFQAFLAIDHTFGDGRIWVNNAKESLQSECRVLTGLAFTRDLQWRVVIKTPAGNSFSMTTDSKGAAAAFKDRSSDTPSGRRAALRNWVSEHFRQVRTASQADGSDECQELIREVRVRRHLRGRIPFVWAGLQCELVVAPFDLRYNERLAAERV